MKGVPGLRLASVVAGALALGVAAPMDAWAQTPDWRIRLFDVALEIRADGWLDVTESITADFAIPKHGIYRTIPIHYEVVFHQYSLRFDFRGVTDGRGTQRQTQVSREGNYVRLRIGDPDRTVTGQHTYQIRYRVQRAVLHEDDRAVLRWNATGTEWAVPIDTAFVTVQLPESVDSSAVRYDAWTGVYGSRAQNFTGRRPDARSIEFLALNLGAREGVTVDIDVPATAVARPGVIRRVAWVVLDNLPYLAFIIVLVGCIEFWRRRGRDLPGRGTIVVEYEPPDGLGPAEVGTIADERVHMEDISAAIIDLAVRGYLEIKDISVKKLFGRDEDYQFIKKREGNDLRDYESAIFLALFDGHGKRDLSDLRYKFYEEIPHIRSLIYERLTSAGYFDGNPETIRRTFAAVAIGIAAALLFGAALLQQWLVGRLFVAPLVVAGLLSLVTVLITARIAPRKTRKGRRAWESVAGLEEYMRRAEQRALTKQEQLGVFERLLPHAIVLGLVDKWAQAFEGIYATPPSWYHGQSTALTTDNLVYSINRSLSAMNSSLAATPRSEGGSSGGFSGGGSSGGGFGGGGGGSW